MKEPDDASVLSSGEVRRRAVRGTVALVGRSTALRAIGLLTNLALTRLLTPRDFGELAIGLTVVAIAQVFVAGGLGAALLRRPQQPTQAELEGVVAFQLALGCAIAGIAAVAASPFGRAGTVTAIMVAVLPIYALRTASVIVTEREMHYGPIVVSEVLETAFYAVAAIGSVVLGAGVYGVACAAVLRSVIGSIYMMVAVPAGRVWPRPRVREVRPLLSFGMQFQAAALISVGRDEGLNLSVAALGGLTMLGYWGLAQRILQIPFLLFDALWRVSFPAMARLADAGEDVKRLLARSSSTLAVGVGVVLVAIAASASDLIPLAFGSRWEPAAANVALPCLGLLLSGPVSVIAAGFLYSVGDARTVLVALGASAVAGVGGALVVLAIEDVSWAPGLGALIGTIVEACLLLVALRRHGIDGVGRRTAIPAACGVLGAIAGHAVAGNVDEPLLAVCVAIAVSECAYLVAALLVCRSDLRDAADLIARAYGRAWRTSNSPSG